MLRGLGVATALFAAWAAPAHACTAQASTTSGPEPLAVTLTAVECAGSTFHWTAGAFAADGETVTLTLPRGAWTPTLTTEEGAFQGPQIAVFGVVLARPRAAVPYRAIVRLQGKAAPPGAGRVSVNGTTARWLAAGVFRVAVRVTRPGPFVARYNGAASKPLFLRVRPKLELSTAGSAAVGGTLAVHVRLRPAGAGTIRVRIGARTRSFRGAGTIRVDTSRARTLRVSVATSPAKGFTVARRALAVPIVQPNLALGSRGPGVLELERMLAAQRYALQRVDASYGFDTYEAVLAFQKVHGLPRTGRVDASLWREIEHAHAPPARYPGNHVEVDKARQVLFVVRGGRVSLVVHVSTGATGNTPLGVWHVYRKVTGFDWVLYYPSYFLRGFAIHGYPDVPAYPASHGCVRIPMWIAVTVYAEIPSGSPVYVYL